MDIAQAKRKENIAEYILPHIILNSRITTIKYPSSILIDLNHKFRTAIYSV